jgi:hypothetical protein
MKTESEYATPTTYNGWTNYATWRVNLEYFDGIGIDPQGMELSEIASDLKEQLEEHLEQEVNGNTQSLAFSYAMAFVSEVNFYEIARHLIEYHAETNA